MELGQITMTRGVQSLIEHQEDYEILQMKLDRYTKNDWGDLPDEDKEQNQFALENGNRILAKYEFKQNPIYIITEWDRSSTTILLTEEY